MKVLLVCLFLSLISFGNAKNRESAPNHNSSNSATENGKKWAEAYMNNSAAGVFNGDFLHRRLLPISCRIVIEQCSRTFKEASLSPDYKYSYDLACRGPICSRVLHEVRRGKISQKEINEMIPKSCQEKENVCIADCWNENGSQAGIVETRYAAAVALALAGGSFDFCTNDCVQICPDLKSGAAYKISDNERGENINNGNRYNTKEQDPPDSSTKSIWGDQYGNAISH